MAAENEVKRSPVRSVSGTALQTMSAAMKVPAHRGRPSKYSPELADAILDRLAQGELLRNICARPGMPSERAVRGWIRQDLDGLFAKYERAQLLGCEVMAEEILTIADDASGDMTVDEKGRPVVDHENINRSRLRVDTRKFLLAKRNPARYSDRQQITGTIEVGQQRPDLSKLSPAELEAFEMLMTKAVIPA